MGAEESYINEKNIKIKNALISVSDKTNLNKLLTFPNKYKINIISSGERLKKLKLGFKCQEVS